MNIAFSTILFFFLILPGLAFRRFYYTGEFSKEYFKTTGFEIFFLGIFPALIIHLIGKNLLPIVTPINLDFFFFHINIPKQEIDFKLLGILLIGKGENEFIEIAFQRIGQNFSYIVSYNFILIIAGASLGLFSKALVRRLKLDRKVKILRFQNEWHYVLSAEIFDFPKVKRNQSFEVINGKLSSVWVDVLVDHGGNGGILYSGLLEDYKLSKDGGLDLMYLTNAYRRLLKDDEKGNSALSVEIPDIKSTINGPYYFMPEHYFIIKYSEVKNLNIYYDFEDQEKISWADRFQTIFGFVICGFIYWGCYWVTGKVIWSIILGTILIYLIYIFAPDENESEDEG